MLVRRANPASAFCGSHFGLVAAGGFKNGTLDSVEWTRDGQTFHSLPSPMPVKAYSMCMAAVEGGKSIVVAGGLNNDTRWSKDAFIYSDGK
jgi:hypothetical protein